MVEFQLSCPAPINHYPQVMMAHGGGGRVMHTLLEELLLPAFTSPGLEARHDGAVLEIEGAPGVRLAFSTDSYVVRPIFFPGGNIGDLAVNGTVNDLAMCGAQPMTLSLGLIIEEGFPMDSLEAVIRTIRDAARAAGVQISTGDTKVVERGKGDGLYINTAGIGIVRAHETITPLAVRPGDAVILSGDVGRHGTAIMAAREGLEFETTITTDCAPLVAPVLRLIEAGLHLHCLRDLTRGGLATGLVEIAQTGHVHIHVDSGRIPVEEQVQGACELLGLDPLYVANEGRFVAFLPPEEAADALVLLRGYPACQNATVIGHVQAGGLYSSGDADGLVTLRSVIGADRVLDMLSGEQLPRIC
jgi:hydrogenase expression/formation protein HypE